MAHKGERPSTKVSLQKEGGTAPKGIFTAEGRGRRPSLEGLTGFASLRPVAFGHSKRRIHG